MIDRTIARMINATGHMPSRTELAREAGITDRQARTALAEYRTRNPNTTPHPLDRIKREAVQEVPFEEPATGYTYSESGDTAQLESPKGTISTLDELLTAAKVDRDVWDVERFTINSYAGFIKDDRGQPQQVPLFQVKAILKRSKPAADLKALRDDTLATIAQHAPTYAPITRAPVRGGHILVLSPADAHIGKGAWSQETGADMGIPEAVQAVRESVEALTTDALPLGISEIVLVIGNDLLQVDNSHGTTYSLTPVDTAGSYRQAFAAARDLMVELTERLTVHAPVTLIFTPGNHDRESVLHLGDYAAAWFRNAPDVTVEAAPTHRKYLTRGKVLLGFTHGNAEKHADLPQIMAQERAADWARATCREWLTGHFHKRGSRHFLPLTETGGVIVRTLPALSRSDLWHSINGYLATPAAEAFVYHPETGLKAQFHHRSVIL